MTTVDNNHRQQKRVVMALLIRDGFRLKPDDRSAGLRINNRTINQKKTTKEEEEEEQGMTTTTTTTWLHSE